MATSMRGAHVLLTTDLSEESFGAFDPTRELVQALGGRITLLHVVPELMVIPYGAPLAPPQAPPDLGELIEEARARLEALRGRLGDVPLRTEVVARESVDRGIVEYAHEHEVTAIAMASHGRTGIRRMVLGSVAESVLRKARLPVFVFPA